MKTLIIGEKREAMADMAIVIGDNGIVVGKTKKEHEEFHEKAKRAGYIEGEKYIFCWAAGHLFRLLKPNELNDTWGLKQLLNKPQDYAIPELRFKIKKIIDSSQDNKQRQIGILKKVLSRNDYDTIINAADADPEGEAIVRDILAFLLPKEKTNIKFLRLWNPLVWNSEITIRDCMSKLEPMSANKYLWTYQTQLARMNSDYLCGMKITKALTDFGGGGKILSSGRIQSFLLHLACQRELEIEDFKKNGPKYFYSIFGFFNKLDFEHFYTEKEDGKDIIKRDYLSESVAKSVLQDIQSNNLEGQVVAFENDKKTTKVRPLPLSGSGFASEMMKEYKISYASCIEILDYLRAQGYTTYPGTNGTYFALSDSACVENAMIAAQKYFGITNAIFSTLATCFNDEKAPTQNHPPLNLTGKIPEEQDLLEWEKATNENGKHIPKVKEGFELIAKRILVHFLPSDSFYAQKIVCKSAGYFFDITGRKPIIQGWRTLLSMELKDSSIETTLRLGDKFKFTRIELKTGKTKKPKPHTIASILSIMINPNSYFDFLLSEEKDPQKILELKYYRKILENVRGIGTDRTRDRLLSIPEERKYWIVQKNGAIEVTPLGWDVENALPLPLKSIETTAKWEIKFEEIRRGEFNYEKFIEVIDHNIMNSYLPEIFNHFSKVGFSFPKDKIDNKTEFACPLCGAQILEKTNAFVCSKQVYENNKRKGCEFSLQKYIKTLDATLTINLVGRILSGEELTTKSGSTIRLDLTSPFFTKIRYSDTHVNTSQRNNSGELVSTEKTFKLGDKFVFKKQFGKDLTEKEALSILKGEEIKIKRFSEKKEKDYEITIWLENDGKCGSKF